MKLFELRDVIIGNNVTLGIGSGVIMDLPDNSKAIGNPTRIIKYKDNAK